jgi:hypothetical protein
MEKRRKRWRKISKRRGPKEGGVELYTPIVILRSRTDGEVNCEVFPPVPNT